MTQSNTVLVAAMDRAGMTYNDLATAARVSHATVKRARQGKKIRKVNAWRIANALQTQPTLLALLF